MDGAIAVGVAPSTPAKPADARVDAGALRRPGRVRAAHRARGGVALHAARPAARAARRRARSTASSRSTVDAPEGVAGRGDRPRAPARRLRAGAGRQARAPWRCAASPPAPWSSVPQAPALEAPVTVRPGRHRRHGRTATWSSTSASRSPRPSSCSTTPAPAATPRSVELRVGDGADAHAGAALQELGRRRDAPRSAGRAGSAATPATARSSSPSAATSSGSCRRSTTPRRAATPSCWACPSPTPASTSSTACSSTTRVPHCRSRVTYKSALQGDEAHTVWVGDVVIRAAAIGTDTYELNRNLLLTPEARADSVPNLEIETGEIAGAGHASATGRFDDEQLFYLHGPRHPGRRGAPARRARLLRRRHRADRRARPAGAPDGRRSRPSWSGPPRAPRPATGDLRACALADLPEEGALRVDARRPAGLRRPQRRRGVRPARRLLARRRRPVRGRRRGRRRSSAGCTARCSTSAPASPPGCPRPSPSPRTPSRSRATTSSSRWRADTHGHPRDPRPARLASRPTTRPARSSPAST